MILEKGIRAIKVYHVGVSRILDCDLLDASGLTIISVSLRAYDRQLSMVGFGEFWIVFEQFYVPQVIPNNKSRHT